MSDINDKIADTPKIPSKSPADKIAYDWDFVNYLESKFDKKVESKMRKIREENKANEEALLKQLSDANSKNMEVSHETKKDFSLIAMLLLIFGGAFVIMGFKNGKTSDKKE